MGEKIETLLSKHQGSIRAILITIVGWSFWIGLYSGKVDDAVTKVEKIEKEGTEYSRATRYIVEQHDKKIQEVNSDLKGATNDIQQMKTDIRLIAEWVQEQKKKGQ